MAFRDDVQLARVCEALCRRIRKGTCWVTEPHPSATTFAIDVLEGKVGLSHGERLIVLAAWSFWNGGDHKLPFAELTETLSYDHLKAIFSLALAQARGPGFVDAWLCEQAGRGGAP